MVTIIRMDQIDAPEKRQAWGKRAKQLLFRLLDKKRLCVAGAKRDRYGRLIAQVNAGSLNVNREMVRMGGAWAYRKYLRDPNLLALEEVARAKRRGLWSMPERETFPPWEFRHAVPINARPSAVRLVPSPPNLSTTRACRSKPQCRQMASCAEAKTWLAQCGGEGIDGDRDGVPCERICLPPKSRADGAALD